MSSDSLIGLGCVLRMKGEKVDDAGDQSRVDMRVH